MAGNSIWGTLAAALLPIAAGGLLWNAGGRDARLAEAQRSLVTLQYARAAEQAEAIAAPGVVSGRLPTLGDAVESTRQTRALVDYWRESDDAGLDLHPLPPGEGAGGEGLSPPPRDPFLAANAAYRASMAPPAATIATEPRDRARTVAAARVARLDEVVGLYAEVLRATPGHADAAYNYEIVIRQRAALAARLATGSASTPGAKGATTGPAGTGTPETGTAEAAGADGPAADAARHTRTRTPHGDAGAPPAAADGKSFKLIVPMRPEERQEAEGASKSGPRQRKG